VRLGRVGHALADPHAPHGRAFFELVPGKLVLALEHHLVVQRLRVVVVDQLERFARLQIVERLEMVGASARAGWAERRA